ncbi:LysR family transcriptional regulator [Burkholderia vietnamiensis]|uniref:LysR family transcriptional regulator n=1 Tax=Burkholderia vietnamiensis TaxID=60552 RepID=UPI00075499C6|nr:LysR family transcriptional regulator [Burkholderia vietnamiensis]KVS05854.1 LysR family transcriptional regulator [Burkholderia vietnamiensis]
MDLKAFRYFDEIVRQGNFGKAAKRLPLSQTALSKAIRLLEDELGVTLLERGRRGVAVKLTSAGEVVLQHARAILAERERMQFDLDALRDLDRGELRLGLPPVGSAELFAAPLAEFRERYPGVSIHLHEHGSAELEQAVRDGELELAATMLPVRTDLQAMFIRREPMVLAVPRGHALETHVRVHLHELNGVPFIALNEGFALTRRLREACIAQGFTINEVAHSAQPNFALALVAAGLGVTCLPRLVARRHGNAGVRLIDLDAPGLEWRVAIVWRKGTTLSWAARAWLDLIKPDDAGVPLD